MIPIPFDFKDKMKTSCVSILDQFRMFNEYCDEKDTIPSNDIYNLPQYAYAVTIEEGINVMNIDLLEMRHLQEFTRSLLIRFYSTVNKIKRGDFADFALDLNDNIVYDKE